MKPARSAGDRVPLWGAVSSVAAPVLMIGGWTVAAGLQRGGFDQVTETISALAGRNADHRWVMTTALAGVGLAHLTTAAALRPAAPAGRALLALGGAATLGVAAAPLPAGGGGSTAHAAFAAVAFVGLAAWPALAGRRGRSGPLGRAVTVTAAAVLLGELAWFFAELVADGPRVGLTERLAAGSQALWPAATVLLLRPKIPVIK